MGFNEAPNTSPRGSSARLEFGASLYPMPREARPVTGVVSAPLRLRVNPCLSCLRWLLPRASIGPHRTLMQRAHRADALVDELLQALPFPGLGRIDIALRVRGDAVHAVE